MGDTYQTIRLAAVQAAPIWLNREETVKKACQLIYEAGENGADVLGFPESFIPGHPVWYYYHPAVSPRSLKLAEDLFKNAVEIPSEATELLCAAARKAKVYVVMGVAEKRPNTTGSLWNTQLFIDNKGKILGKHQKLVPTISERLVHMPGDGSTMRTFPTQFGQISSLCCGENFNPFAVSVLTAEYTVLHVANWPHHFPPDYTPMSEISLLASRNIAYTAKCYVISACGINSEEMLEALPVTKQDKEFLSNPQKTGGTAIINPRGDIIAGPWINNKEGILYADADLEMTVRGRLFHDFGGHYNRPDVFRLFINESNISLLDRITKPKQVVNNESLPVEEEESVHSNEDL